MPSVTGAYEVLLDLTNDTRDFVSVQLLRDYGRNTASAVVLGPGETITLVLDAGSIYSYAVKTHTKVANITARTWRDTRCNVSRLFTSPSCHPANPAPASPTQGITVDRLWRDFRFCVANEA
ncbi:hypothetical protein GLOTRDRAFT_31975 [Gloeophyllum trabeum ATCC 11539]|uniref:Uncharacterized protein n=1 Tax=Gloeophyllum trabeum (strain ATCC 11539 / FP-39264 / Madison 617) TaxID=670483 RepID=S7QMP5_GLOTA|nr:uncharacterized protein GLOTRDRAFT_31975 [Gloeophyllum trabeum ATCC 11539]EPQ60738.1 hypothetical protein GLOTRDRAFT_31975 [Gloeophyllum trabeum ATCC 11539]